jgi:hypothetical protein
MTGAPYDPRLDWFSVLPLFPRMFTWDYGKGAGELHLAREWKSVEHGHLFTMHCGARCFWNGLNLEPGDGKLPRCEGCR